jgi:hypothetical protein
MRLLLKSSKEFQNIALSLKRGTYLATPKYEATKHISFTLKQAAKLVHHSKYRYNIKKTMHLKIEFFHEKLQPLASILWEAPIAHIIPRVPTAMAFGNSCLEGTGGYSISLGFWWHLPFPEKVIQQTLIHKKGQQGWSAHLNQRSRICHGYHKLLHIPARVHNKEHNR